MTSRHTLEERLAAVERAVTDEDVPLASVDDAAELTARIEAVESRLGTLEARIDEVDAAVTAVRGYVGEVRHVNEDVERTANAAVAAVDRLEPVSGTQPPIATERPAESRVTAAETETSEADGPSKAGADRSFRDRLGALL